LGLDHNAIDQYEPEARLPHLQRIRNHVIRGEVILHYTLVDENLNNRLCRYFFGKRSFIKLWRTKRFRNFNYYILERLSLLEKLTFVRAIRVIPKPVLGNIERLNALRNGIAHAFFPENLRSAKPVYKGKSIFTVEGLEVFVDDMREIHNTLWQV
jgi:hypothetical protein